jgi:hypothetical protein
VKFRETNLLARGGGFVSEKRNSTLAKSSSVPRPTASPYGKRKLKPGPGTSFQFVQRWNWAPRPCAAGGDVEESQDVAMISGLV